MKIRRLSLVLWTLSLVILVSGVAISFVLVQSSLTSQRDQLKVRTQSIANALSKDTIDTLTATEEDLESEQYLTLKQSLQSIAEVNEDIEFVYITKLIDENVYFLADSEPAGSEDESPPGQLYEEVDIHYVGIHNGSPADAIGPTTDRWGTWISGVAPIIKDEEVIAVLGIDIPANDYFRSIYINIAIVMAPTLFFIFTLLLYARLGSQKERELSSNLEVMSIVVGGIKSPLEQTKLLAQDLNNKLAGNPEFQVAVTKMLGALDRISESITDIVHVQTEPVHKSTSMTDRLDVVATINEILEQSLASVQAKRISLNVASDWPASYVITNDLKEFNRVVTTFFAELVERTQVGDAVDVTFIEDSTNWAMQARTGQDLSRGTSDLLNTELIGRIGARVTYTAKTITLTFTRSGDEIKRG